MKVSLNWLNDYIDFKNDLSIKEISKALVSAGLEVEHIEHFGDGESADVVISLNITPNRADALSHLGIARELCAHFDLPLRSFMLSPVEMAGLTHERVSIDVEDADDCHRYAVRVVEGVKIAKSPDWLKNRLLACGISPINNVVDITNYVMLSRGQPLHAFDFDKISKEGNRAKIFIRRAKEFEEILLLNHKPEKLLNSDLVIADQNGPIALAGIMGGIESSISESTENIIIESASFNQKNIRMTAKRLGLSTESSFRFERGVDPNGVLDALNYASRLIAEITTGKVTREPVESYKKRFEPIEVGMRLGRAREFLGLSKESFDEDALRKKFVALGIETVAKRGDAIYFRIPTFRLDLSREIDLIEETIRMIGFDKVLSKTVGNPQNEFLFIDKNNEKIKKNISTYLVARGFCEAINYAFNQRDFIELFLTSDQKDFLIDIKNPLSSRYGVMIPSLLPGLLNNVLYNQRNQEKEILLFETGVVFLKRQVENTSPNPKLLDLDLSQDSYAVEEEMVAAVLCGNFDFYFAKGLVENCLKLFNLNTDFPNKDIYFCSDLKEAYFHPGMSANIYYQDQKLGAMGKLHPGIKERMGLSNDVYMFELSIKKISQSMPKEIVYTPFSRFPSVERDIAFLLDEEIKVDNLLSLIKEIEKYQEILRNIMVFDIYRGDALAPNKKSVAVSLKLQSNDRTLNEEEVDAFISKYIDIVKEKTGGSLR